MVQKTSVAVLSHGTIYLAKRNKEKIVNFDEFRFQPLLVTFSIRCIIKLSFFKKSETCPTFMNKETRDDNSLTVTLGFSR